MNPQPVVRGVGNSPLKPADACASRHLVRQHLADLDPGAVGADKEVEAASCAYSEIQCTVGINALYVVTLAHRAVL